MKYIKWVGLLAALLLIVICFIPWTYHADVGKNFTGFFSEKNTYGKPGVFFVFFGIVFIALTLIAKVWTGRINLFLSAIMVAYAFKTYILYTSCYNAYCPEKKAGIYLLVICNLMVLLAVVFPDIRINNRSKNEDPS